MHRITYNELRLDFSLIPVSHLSIQARGPVGGKTLPHFVRAVHPVDGTPSVFIPGSTWKGTLRHAAEQILADGGIVCCDRDQPCAKREAVEKARASRNYAAMYRALCPACKLFGSSVLRGHLAVTDCFPAEAIDRLPRHESDQGEAVETVVDEPFYGTLTLRNFERWHVGLLALLLAHVNLADVQIGGNRSAGMGSVALRYGCLSLVYPGLPVELKRQEALQSTLHGVGQLAGQNHPYGFTYPDAATMADLPEDAVFQASVGFNAVLIGPDKSGDPEGRERIHSLIDNTLTQQALAWAAYVRARKPISGKA